MSKIIPLHTPYRDTYPVAAATVTTGWKPGQGAKLDTNGENAVLAIADATLFIMMDASTELSAPPTGSVCTGIYGSGTKFVIDHSEEVAASDATRAYESDVNQLLLVATFIWV